ncbi:MAG: 4Fe-4S dicluster domain-containing protein [Omnitrophica bacterium]|nr:4Fe-4S dicluster domain-containing protein [Candidatus Omnitrophota bacterium]
MSKVYKLTIENKDIFSTVNSFFQKLLEEKIIDNLLLPQESLNSKSVMQTLVKSPQELGNANPFAPLLLVNSATLVSQLTIDNPQSKLGAVMRSCEIRAAIELAKLKQINLERLVIIGVDCPGIYESTAYQKIIEKYKDSQSLTRDYLSKSLKNQLQSLEGQEIRLACKGCEYPNPENFSIALNFFGCDVDKEIFIQFADNFPQIDPEKLNLLSCEDNGQWRKAIDECRDRRTKTREEIFKQVFENIKDIKSFLKEFEHCRRCYNCRKECPICYCRECIFDSLTFEHASEQYFGWARKKGKIRMPSDTLLFHITRMNHMAISCVGCGQCSSACPNGIPIAKFFKTIGFKVQELFDYKPGRNPDEEIPQSTFKEDEFPEVGLGPKSKA